MEVFSHHKLIKSGDGYTVILYLEEQPSEFANEFILTLDKKRKGLQEKTADYVKNYIDKNLPGFKVNTVKIMVGSLLIASLPMSSIITTIDKNSNEALAQDKATPAVEAEDTVNTEQSLSMSGTSGAISNPTSVLALVNKKYHLPSNYVPQNLAVPDVPFPYNGFHQKKLMRQDAAKALEALFAQARRDNINIYAISGYRSYQTQKGIFESNTKKYGSASAANRFSARPGESEHQTGLAMDISSPSVNFSLTQSFANTKEGQWLKENAPKYGFIIRYPQGRESITGYAYEPWHIRYVGTTASFVIAERDITLEQYLGRT